MKLIVSTLLCFVIGSMIAKSQSSKDEQKEEKTKEDSLMLVGRFSFENWQREMNWQLDTSFSIESNKLNELDDLIAKENITFIIFAGSWCKDSRSELPKIMEIMKRANVNESKYE